MNMRDSTRNISKALDTSAIAIELCRFSLAPAFQLQNSTSSFCGDAHRVTPPTGAKVSPLLQKLKRLRKPCPRYDDQATAQTFFCFVLVP
jgi:hypothetical protein